MTVVLLVLAVIVSSIAIYLAHLPPAMGVQRILEITGGALVAIYLESVIVNKNRAKLGNDCFMQLTEICSPPMIYGALFLALSFAVPQIDFRNILQIIGGALIAIHFEKLMAPISKRGR